MKNTLLLFSCLVMAATFSSCIEDQYGLTGMQDAPTPTHIQPDATGLPVSVTMQSVVFTSKTGVTSVQELPHVVMVFTNCDDVWCKALTDDCGNPDDVSYNFDDSAAVPTMRIDSYATVPAVGIWAGTATFDFAREGTAMTLSCSDCPGITQDGFEYLDRKVSFKVRY